MKNKILQQLIDFIDEAPTLNRSILKDKIYELDNQSQKRFVVPKIEEIEVYCIERNNGIDASNFFDFYQSKDWMIGKNKMKDWRASVRTWERNNKPNSSQNNPNQNNSVIGRANMETVVKNAQFTPINLGNNE